MLNSLAATLCVALLVLPGLAACRSESVADAAPVPSGPAVTGRVLLPDGEGRRGLDLWITVMTPEREVRESWVMLDEQGRFTREFEGALVRAVFSAGSETVLKLDASAMPDADATGLVDLGELDLRDRVTSRSVMLRAAEGAAPGVVRMGMWLGPPPVGPQGGSVSLGSIQFPDLTLGHAVEWLFPRDARAIHFVVERPEGSESGRVWRSGKQRVFGPFTLADLPDTLFMD